jgi:hypothetical protein
MEDCPTLTKWQGESRFFLGVEVGFQGRWRVEMRSGMQMRGYRFLDMNRGGERRSRAMK